MFAKEEGVAVKLNGGLYSLVNIKQDTGLEIGNYLKMNTAIFTGDDFYARFSFFIINEGAHNYLRFPNFSRRLVEPSINYVFINMRGPLMPNGQPINMRLGYNNIEYSPYIAHFGDMYGHRGRGLQLDGLSWCNTKFDFFHTWEQTRDYWLMVQGMQSQFNLGKLDGKLVLIQHHKGDHVVDADGNIIELAKYKPYETSYHLEGEYQLSPSTSIKYLRAQQHLQEEKETKVVERADLRINTEHSWRLSYRDFEPGFDPRFRKRTPRYDLVLREDLGWNPVIQYQDQKGIELDFSGLVGSRFLRLNFDNFLKKSEPQQFRSILDLQLAGRTSYDLFVDYDQTLKEFRYREFGLKRSLGSFSFGNARGFFKYLNDQTGKNNRFKQVGTIADIGVESTVRNGFFQGLSLAMGLQHSPQGDNIYYLQGTWKVRNNFEIDFFHNTPTITGSEEALWLDDYGRLQWRDNLISCQFNMYF
jgi:hypothetical protein